MKAVAYIRSVNPLFDGRINKFLKVLDVNHLDNYVLWWDRLGEKPNALKKPGVYSFARRAKLGARWANLIGLLSWNLYIFYWLIKNKNRIGVVQAVDFDCIIPSYFFAKVFNKKIIFDVYDKYSDAKSIGGLASKFINFFEYYFIRNSDLTILVDECRYSQHNVEKSSNIVVIENVPSFLELNSPCDKNHIDSVVVGYFGSLEPKHRGLEDLAEFIIDSKEYVLKIAGYGELYNFFENMSKLNPEKIFFYGKLDSESGMSLMQDVDIYFGMYYLTNRNHLWAAPNKYYEHLMLGIPLLTTIKTPPGDKVTINKTGWAIAEGRDNLDNFFEKTSRSEMREYGANAKKIWLTKFNSYYDSVYLGVYMEKLKNLIDD